MVSAELAPDTPERPGDVSHTKTTHTVHEPTCFEPGHQSAWALEWEQYLALPRAANTFLLDPILPTGGSLLLYGDPKAGKSFAALQLASSLANGGDWLGFHCPAPGRVLYIQLDTPRSLWADRAENLKRSGLATDGVLLADRETIGHYPFNILQQEHWETLRAMCDIHQPTTVILDVLKETHRANENEASEMQQVIAQLTAAVNPAALILVSHGRKVNPEFGRSLINDHRGSNYVPGRMDGVLSLQEVNKEKGEFTMCVTGRAVEETTVHLWREKLPWGGFKWHLDPRQRTAKLAQELLADDSLYQSIKGKAQRLAELTNTSPEACEKTDRELCGENQRRMNTGI